MEARVRPGRGGLYVTSTDHVDKYVHAGDAIMSWLRKNGENLVKKLNWNHQFDVAGMKRKKLNSSQCTNGQEEWEDVEIHIHISGAGTSIFLQGLPMFLAIFAAMNGQQVPSHMCALGSLSPTGEAVDVLSWEGWSKDRSILNERAEKVGITRVILPFSAGCQIFPINIKICCVRNLMELSEAAWGDFDDEA